MAAYNVSRTIHATFPPGPPSQSPDPSAQTGGSEGNAAMSIFSTAAGPPLILVFLAAGLLAGGLLTLLVLKKLYPQRGQRLAASTAAVRRRGPRAKKFGEKPILWDVHLEMDEDEDKQNLKWYRKWTSYQPMAVTFIPDEDRPPSPPNSDPTPQSSVSSRFSKCLRHLYFGRAKPVHAMPVEMSDVSEGKVQGRLQIAMIISMPSPIASQSNHRSPSRLPFTKLWDSQYTPAIDYCLGISESQVSWQGAGHLRPLMTEDAS